MERRTEHTNRSETLPDGTVVETSETREEIVPMRVTSRTTRKLKLMPIEEKSEVFDEDGKVITPPVSVPLPPMPTAPSVPITTLAWIVAAVIAAILCYALLIGF